VVGIGPGGQLDRTFRAQSAIEASEVIAGYKRYIKAVDDLIGDKTIIATGMTKEVDRCQQAIKAASEGKVVALISSGDAGIYGMAGLTLEMIQAEQYEIEVEVIPGVTAASAAAARLGAPLMLDFAIISLSDLLVEWAVIRQRIQAVAKADLVVAFYNPRSRKRIKQLDEAIDILLEHRSPATLVGIGTDIGSQQEHLVITTLGELLQHEIGMRSLVIIGNSESKVLGKWLVNPRGYQI
jgi:precorrin-3B C17-methyltransferase